MHGLEVRCSHVRVSLRGFKVRVPHDFLQTKDISAPTQIACCERVPGCMERACWCVESQREAKPLDIAQHVAAVERRLCRCCEKERFRLAAEVCNVAVDSSGVTQNYEWILEEGESPFPIGIQRGPD
jgi:hypothetical protein